MIDTFCMEIMGIKKASFDFEQELLNQAKVMHSAYASGPEVVWLEKFKD